MAHQATREKLVRRILDFKDYLDTNGYDNMYVMAGEPTESNDETEGYNLYDMVLNSNNDDVWQIIDTTTGAAVWVNTGYKLQDVATFGNTVYDNGDVSGDVTIDARNGEIQLMATAGNVTSLTVNNLAEDRPVKLFIDNSGANTCSLGAGWVVDSDLADTAGQTVAELYQFAGTNYAKTGSQMSTAL